MSNLETTEKLEQIEASAIENTSEVKPLEEKCEGVEVTELPEEVKEENVREYSSCRCTGGCGSGTYSITTSCRCTGNCGSGTYHR